MTLFPWANLMNVPYYLRKWLAFQYPDILSTSYKTCQSLKAMRFVFEIVQYLWNLTVAFRMSNFKALRSFKLPMPWLWHLTRGLIGYWNRAPCDKLSYKLKGSHVDYFVVTDYTWGGPADHLKCSQWLQSSPRNSLSVPMPLSCWRQRKLIVV